MNLNILSQNEATVQILNQIVNLLTGITLNLIGKPSQRQATMTTETTAETTTQTTTVTSSTLTTLLPTLPTSAITLPSLTQILGVLPQVLQGLLRAKSTSLTRKLCQKNPVSIVCLLNGFYPINNITSIVG